MTRTYRFFAPLITAGRRARSSGDAGTCPDEASGGVGHFATPNTDGKPHATFARNSESCPTFLEAQNG